MSAVRDHVTPGRSDLHTLASGGVLNVAGSVANFLLQFLLVIVVTRVLRAEGAGLFFEAVAVFSILASAAQLGADTGLVRTISRFQVLGRTDDLRSILYVAIAPVLVVGSLYAVAVYVLAPQLADLLMHEADLSDGVASLRLLAPFLPLAAATTVALSGARGFGTMLPYVAVEYVAKPMLRPLLVLVAVALGFRSRGVVLSWAIPVAIGFPVALWAVLRLLRRSQRAERPPATEPPRPLGAIVREFWAFAAPRGLATLFQITIIWLSTLMVGALAGVREAGIYAAASRFALVGLFALEAVRLAIAPQLSALLAAHDRDRAEHLYQVGTWWIMIPSWPLYLSLAVFSPLLLQIFGPEFVVAQTALMIASLAMLVSMGTGNVTVILLMGGKSWWNLLNVLGALTLNVLLNLYLIPRYGIAGAALAWA
ncbi:MAG: MATE family efflux transporter, partial [Actinomycetota bacterium]